ncbi:MAG TPA: hypothetical protein GXZ56_09690 [Bacteroidales bacterium]|jgi:hypothetical protein|nr:hypothetical protein [Bacteroidales bacterium]
MKRIHTFLLAIVILVAATACDTQFDYHLSRSIFVPDEDNPGLPIYSEKGYNSFGVYWSLKPFTSQSNEEPSQVVVRGDSCHIHFHGKADYAPYTLTFSIHDFKPGSYSELLTLNGKKYDLKKEQCVVTLTSGTDTLDVKVQEGEFYIQRAQNLYVDNVLTRVVLSGTFSFKAMLNNAPTSFLNGRFDMGYGDENFFLLQGR